MTEEQRNQLLELAGEMVRGEGMPSREVDDWQLPKSTSARTRRKIRKAALLATDRARDWALEIASIIDRDRREARS